MSPGIESRLKLMPLAFVMLFAIWVYDAFFRADNDRRYLCEKLKKFENTTINCRVKNKYVDTSNHSVRTILFTNCENMLINDDTTNYYNFVKVGDSIVKKTNTDTLSVYRGIEVHKFKIYFGCDSAYMEVEK